MELVLTPEAVLEPRERCKVEVFMVILDRLTAALNE